MERKLTGKWYIKRKLFGFKIMVEVQYITFYPPLPLKYEIASENDLAELNIKIY